MCVYSDPSMFSKTVLNVVKSVSQICIQNISDYDFQNMLEFYKHGILFMLSVLIEKQQWLCSATAEGDGPAGSVRGNRSTETWLVLVLGYKC